MSISWISLYPDWYMQEISLLHKHYPKFKIDQGRLQQGYLTLYGNLIVRPPGGAKEYPVQLRYLASTPYEHPRATPIESLPEWTDTGTIAAKVEVKMLDHRHQMPTGNLCLFQHETRSIPGGDILRGVDILKRAERYFIGLNTGHWPPDTFESELESHFTYVTDMLVAETFYKDVKNGHGKFFFVGDIYRLRDAQNQTLGPSIVIAMTEESNIIQNFDAREELSRVYPWITNAIWDSYDFILKNILKEDDPLRIIKYGYWWSLPQEPLPFHDGASLLRTLASTTNGNVDEAWDVFNTTLGADLTTASHYFIGFRYPSRVSGYEWLFLLVIGNAKRGTGGVLIQRESVKRRRLENSRLFVLKVHRIASDILKQRNRTVVKDDINKKTVALIGLGALGSKVAELLAQAGIGKFRLCDNDRLKTGNVARHIGGIRDFGAPKVNVIRSRLLEINPYLEFDKKDILAESAVNSLDRLVNFMAPAHLVICTTADEGVESVINQLAIIHKKTIIYGRAIRRGSMGRVFLVRPGKDACKRCLSDYLNEGRNGVETPEDWIDVPEKEQEIIFHECGRPVIASSAIDLSYTASLIARVSLDYLEGKSILYNHWLWSLYPAPDITPRFAVANTTFTGVIPPKKDCAACQEPDVVELLITEEVKQKIISETKSSRKVETGGVLIGYIDSQRRAIVVRATGPGPKAIRTEQSFHRDVEYIQSELDKAISELGNKGLYVGEWHSHLAESLQPSPKDIESLFGISVAPNYLTPYPVLLLTGVSPDDTKSIDLCSWVFQIGRRIYKVHCRMIDGKDSEA